MKPKSSLQRLISFIGEHAPKLAAAIRELLSSTEGDGLSSTKSAFLFAAVMGVLSCTAITLIGAGVYIWSPDHDADNTFWLAVGGLWGTVFGFITGAKIHQTSAARDVTISENNPPPDKTP